MKLKVEFNNDPTGMGNDITETVIIQDGVCLFCQNDNNQNINRLSNEVKKALEYKGYDFSCAFYLLNVYSVDS